jgi:pyridoxal phosphate enzyme (YggS family)
MSQELRPVDPGDVARRWHELRERLDALAGDRSPEVGVVAVTKGFDASAIEAACAVGAEVIGENYAQQILAKRDAIERLRPDVHFIGHLQSNKVRQLTDLVTVWGTLDRNEVAKRCPGARVRLQVNTTGEAQKAGVAPEQLSALLERAGERGLTVEGLMTVGPTGGTPDAARPAFARLRALVDRFGLEVCSMGMTHDLEVAIEEGSTEIRVGTALFGARPD